MTKHSKTLLLLALITIVGFVLRLVNISKYIIYPDGYQSLLVSRNIALYHSILGPLGPNGMLYPDIFWWTRPLYPLLIQIVHAQSVNLITSAVVVSITASVFGIVAAFFVAKLIFKSSLAGLCAAGLLAISFNHIVWSGFILTESTGVATLLIFLGVFAYRQNQIEQGNKQKYGITMLKN